MTLKNKLVRGVLFTATISLMAACSTGSGTAHRASTPNEYRGITSNTSLSTPWRPTMKDSVPATMNPAVSRWIETFNGNLHDNFARWIKRIGHYGPTIDKILDEEGVPRDLIYLAMIESGFNMRALSTASAAGPWQFIQSTGKMYGLNKGFFIDERQDFVQATRAAARHLRDLYKIYGDWYLAFAAYNAGSGKVNSAIRQSGTTDYWKLAAPRSRFLRQETKDYVPKILAARQIVKNYKKYGYNDSSFGDPLAYESVKVPDATDINVIAKSANTSAEIIQTLNPSLVIGITPPGKEFEVYIPKGAGEEFEKNYSSVPISQRVSHLQYTVTRRDSLASIAKQYHVSPAQIAKINNYSQAQNPQPGETIKIPATQNSLLALEKLASERTSTQIVYYKTRKGDSLKTIAQNNNVSVSSLSRWNHLSARSRLKAGQSIKIYKKSAVSLPVIAKLNPKAPSQNNRLSGIAFIVMQDEQNPAEFKPARIDEIDVSTIVAANDTVTDAEVDFDSPAIIKTADGNVIDQTQTEEQKADLQKSSKSTSAANSTPPKSVASKFHVVKSGENLTAIAAKYDLRTDDLKALNNLDTNQIRVNQKLLVSRGKSLVTPSNTAAKNAVHVVKPNETLTSIAKSNGVTIRELKDWNGLNSDQVNLGQKLKVLKGVAPQIASISPDIDSQKKTIVHQVKNGETLWMLSRKYGVKISEIIKWNNLKTNQVKPNQRIKIIASASQNSQHATM